MGAIKMEVTTTEIIYNSPIINLRRNSIILTIHFFNEDELLASSGYVEYFVNENHLIVIQEVE